MTGCCVGTEARCSAGSFNSSLSAESSNCKVPQNPELLHTHSQVKNVERIELGKYEMETWYFSPLPAEFSNCKVECGHCDAIRTELELAMHLETKRCLQRFCSEIDFAVNFLPGVDMGLQDMLLAC